MSKNPSSRTKQPAGLADEREIEDQYRELLEQVADLIQVVAPDGSFRYANRAWRETLGYAADEIPRLSLSDVLHPDSRARGIELFQRLPDCSQPARVEAKLLAKDGRAIAVEGQSCYRFRDGQPIATLSILRDVTRRKSAEAALIASEEKYHLFVESLPDIVWSSDEQGELVFISSNIELIVGYTPQEMYSSGDALWFGRMHSEDVERARQAYRNLFERGEKFDVEYRIQRKDGEWIWLHDRAISMYEEGRKTYTTGISIDITELKRAEESLRNQTLTDDLTGLKNRRGFITLAEQQLKVSRAPRKQEPLLLVYADMDDLKQINDRFGHHVGSQALVETAQIIRHTCRETDIIGRIGGDEFAILVAPAVADSDTRLTERLQENLRHFNQQNSQPYLLSLSLGTTRIEAGSTASIEELLTQADEAMYEHKRSKKQGGSLKSEV